MTFDHFKSQNVIISIREMRTTAGIFDHAHPKIIELTFSFPQYITACKKSVYSTCLFSR